MKKIKLLVLFGGQSTEHEVSCLSAYSVLKNIDTTLFAVEICGISKSGDWLYIENTEENLPKIKNGSCFEKVKRGSGIAPALEAIERAEVVFPVMHGIMAEDGTIQGLLTVLGKPFVGPGVLASALCMDKAYTKIVLEAAGVPVARGICVNSSEPEDFVETAEKVNNIIGYPCFVKPSNSGSSVGAFKVNYPRELEEKVRKAWEYDNKVLIEEYIKGKEVECAVLGCDKPRASTPGEILSTAEFYDYDDKYINGTSSTKIPADIPEAAAERIKELAVKAFKATDCTCLARVDFFYVPESGRIVLNEINTIPGFTDISMYGKMLAYDGLPYGKLITKLIMLSLEKKGNRFAKAL